VGAQVFTGFQRWLKWAQATTYEDYRADFETEQAAWAAKHLHGGETHPGAHTFGSRITTAEPTALVPNPEGVLARLDTVVDGTETTVAELLTDMYGRVADGHPDHTARDLRRLGEALRMRELDTSNIENALAEEARTPSSKYYRLLEAMQRATKAGK
jgi:hypothetical protein